MTTPYDWIAKSLDTIHQANWYRTPKTITSRPGPIVELEGRSLINFASNDYLGLAEHPHLIQAAITAIQKYGTGSTGSRLLSGHRDLHRQLELALANFKQTEDAIVFSSGYLANLGTITALVGRRDLILSDQYNHSSLKNGAKLSEAKVIDYNHCDLQDLQNKLEQYRTQYRHCLILSDSVFSMDGDICQVPQLLDLADAYECMLLLDEAHAIGVIGKNGAGCVEYFGCTDRPLIQMGTLSKALGSLGGYVTGDATLIDFLRNRAATWIYTTALSPADTAAALAAIKIIQNEPQRREKLWHNINFLQQEFSHLSFLPSQSSIICLECANPAQALELSQKLTKTGIFAPAIRPPTVPTSRIRFSIMASHEKEHLEKLIDNLIQSLDFSKKVS